MAPEDPRATSSGLAAGRFQALVLLFAVSGAAGLVDQVCFSKYLSYVVGSTAYAVSAVLAAFMTGLTVGAWGGGWLSRRVRRPMVAYGVAEIAVGISVALTPIAFQLLTPAYVAVARGAEGSLPALSAIRWGVASLVVFLPTVAMGATLPLVSPALGRVDQATMREKRLGALYAANTFGGAGGALLGAYVVLPALGLSHTILVAAAISALTGAIAVSVGGTVFAPDHAETRVTSPEAAARSRLGATDGVLALSSGVLVFMAEVVATHLLAVIVGNSAYAFGLILASFLVCLFVGAIAAPWASRRFGNRALPGSLLLSAWALAATLPLWDELPLLFGGLGEYVVSFQGREAMRAVVSFGILAVPVTLMGLTFPLLLQRAAGAADVGRRVGQLTAVNTVGAVLGAMATGYAVLPILGSQGSFVAMVVAFAALALLASGAERTVRVATGALGAVAVVAALVPSWDFGRLTKGTNVYFDEGGAADNVVFLREDVHGGITTVTDVDGVRTLYTNGKFQGNTGWEMNAQRYFAHYPCLFVEDFDKALVIGLGTGTTLGTLAAYPWTRIQVVEISPSIVEAARTYFTEPNRGVLDGDPRVQLTLDDARNWLLVHDERFDLISMELSSVWFAGASSLYSEEFYELARGHLRDRGIFQQWVQLHHVTDPVFATMLATVRRKFEHVALFYGGGQGIIVAAEHPLSWSPARTARMNATPKIQDVLPYERPLSSLIGDILVMDDGLDAFLGSVAEDSGIDPKQMVSNDDNLFLEYQTPRGNVLPWEARERLVAKIKRYRDADAIENLALRTASRDASK